MNIKKIPSRSSQSTTRGGREPPAAGDMSNFKNITTVENKFSRGQSSSSQKISSPPQIKDSSAGFAMDDAIWTGANTSHLIYFEKLNHSSGPKKPYKLKLTGHFVGLEYTKNGIQALFIKTNKDNQEQRYCIQAIDVKETGTSEHQRILDQVKELSKENKTVSFLVCSNKLYYMHEGETQNQEMEDFDFLPVSAKKYFATKARELKEQGHEIVSAAHGIGTLSGFFYKKKKETAKQAPDEEAVALEPTYKPYTRNKKQAAGPTLKEMLTEIKEKIQKLDRLPGREQIIKTAKESRAYNKRLKEEDSDKLDDILSDFFFTFTKGISMKPAEELKTRYIIQAIHLSTTKHEFATILDQLDSSILLKSGNDMGRLHGEDANLFHLYLGEKLRLVLGFIDNNPQNPPVFLKIFTHKSREEYATDGQKRILSDPELKPHTLLHLVDRIDIQQTHTDDQKRILSDPELEPQTIVDPKS